MEREGSCSCEEGKLKMSLRREAASRYAIYNPEALQLYRSDHRDRAKSIRRGASVFYARTVHAVHATIISKKNPTSTTPANIPPLHPASW